MPNIKDMFSNVVGSNFDETKNKVDENVKNTSSVINGVTEKYKNFSLNDLTDTKLSTAASSFGVDTNKLNSMTEIVDGIKTSGVNTTNPAELKKELLNKLTEKNLTKNLSIGDGLNKNLIGNIGSSIGINPIEIEKMVDSKNSVKILADIKNIKQFENLDDTVKQKIMENNFLPNMDVLNDIMQVSTDLMSSDLKTKENATKMAQGKIGPEIKNLLGNFNNTKETIKIINPPNAPVTSFASSFSLEGGGGSQTTNVSDGGVMGQTTVTNPTSGPTLGAGRDPNSLSPEYQEYWARKAEADAENAALGNQPPTGVKGQVINFENPENKPKLIVWYFEYDAFELIKPIIDEYGREVGIIDNTSRGSSIPRYENTRNPKIVVKNYATEYKLVETSVSSNKLNTGFFSFDELQKNFYGDSAKNEAFWLGLYSESSVKLMIESAKERKKLFDEHGIEITRDGLVTNNGIVYSIYELELPNGQKFVDYLKNILGEKLTLLPNKDGVNIETKNINKETRFKQMKLKFDNIFRSYILTTDGNAKKNGRDPLVPIYEWEVIDESKSESYNGNTDFIENFNKLDYRVQKVAAVSMGYTDENGGVAKFKEVIDKLKEYKKLDELSKSYTETLLSHVDNLKIQETKNSEIIKDYKEQHGISDNDYEAAIENAYNLSNIIGSQEKSSTESDFTQSPEKIYESMQKEILNENRIDNPIPLYLGLDINLFQKDSDGNLVEPYVYNGSIVLTGIKDSNSNLLTSIPIKITKVLGNFVCKNMNLTSLQNAPDTVNGNFDCSNNSLKTLIGGPKNVYGTYNASNNQLENLKGLFTANNVDVSNNRLKSLHSYPQSNEQPNIFINGNLNVSNNLVKDMHSNITIYGELNASRNFITDSSFTVAGNELPKLYSKASIILSNQLNQKMLDEFEIRSKLQLNDEIKIIT